MKRKTKVTYVDYTLIDLNAEQLEKIDLNQLFQGHITDKTAKSKLIKKHTSEGNKPHIEIGDIEHTIQVREISDDDFFKHSKIVLGG